MTTDRAGADDALANRLARLQARRGERPAARSGPAAAEPDTGGRPTPARPGRRRRRAAEAGRILATGAAVAGTGAMVTVMALGASSADPAPTPGLDLVTAPPTVEPAPVTAPPVVVVYRLVPVTPAGPPPTGTSTTILPTTVAATAAPVPAPTRSAPPPSSSTRSSGS